MLFGDQLDRVTEVFIVAFSTSSLTTVEFL